MLRRLFAAITAAAAKEVGGLERARTISEELNNDSLERVVAWAQHNCPRGLPEATSEQRAKVLRAVLACYKKANAPETAAPVIARALGTSIAESTVIALTEVTRLVGYASFDDMRRAGFPKKKWLTCRDHLVRPSHKALDRQVVSMDAPFVTPDGKKALFPGGFDDEHENKGCRCAIRAVIPSEEQ